MILTDRFKRAMDMAYDLHKDQERKASKTPYLGHLLGVAGSVIELGGSEDEAIAALLHDAIEDQGGPAARQRILEAFGEGVTAIVDGCTDTDQTPKPPWLERKKMYLEHIKTAGSSVLLVSTADKLNNVRSITHGFRQQGDAVWQSFKGGREGSLWYYRAFVDTVREFHGSSLVLEELDRAVQELEKLLEE